MFGGKPTAVQVVGVTTTHEDKERDFYVMFGVHTPLYEHLASKSVNKHRS